MKRALVTSSKYSPGNMTPEALEALFVGREKTLTDVLKRIAASATGAGKHYILLVGPRGVGKTHFVALLYHRLVSDPQYATARSRLKIAYLNEEEWGVASFLDLLVRILNALAAGQRDAALEAQIERIYEVHEKDAVRAREAAEALLRQVVGKDTLLLLCENLVDIFQGLGEEGQKRWRAYIQEHPFWTILATTPALFTDVQLQTSPFYGFFTERRLEKLDYEMAVQLLKKKAEIDGHTELARAIDTPTGRARVRAIHHLAGGNHRVYVIMSEFLDRESLDELVKPFMRMVDDLTPYYQDRMRQLAPQQRKLLEFLSRHEVPAMVKVIAQRCLISQQTAAKQLGELAKLGFVQSIKSGRAAYYEIAEPLMRICVEVKDNKTEHLRLFVRFLREWFTARELTARLRILCAAGVPERHVDRLHIEAALRDCEAHPDEPLLKALREEAHRCRKNGDDVGLAEAYSRLAEETDEDRYHALYVLSLIQAGNLDEAARRLEAAMVRHTESYFLAHAHGCLLFHSEQFARALLEFNRAIELKPSELFIILGRGEALTLLGWYRDVLLNAEAGLRTYPNEPNLCKQAAWALALLGRFDEARALARALMKATKSSPTNLQDTLPYHINQYADAVESFLRHATDDADVPRLAALATLVKGGAVDFQRGARSLAENLAALRRGITGSGREVNPAETLAMMIAMEASTHSPAHMAEQLLQARSTLEKPGLDDLLGDALSQLLNALLSSPITDATAWEDALPILTRALADLPECELPLKMLGAAVRYSRTFDVADLIDLPLEQRALLIDAFEKHPRPAATPDVPSTASQAKTDPASRPSQRARRPARA